MFGVCYYPEHWPEHLWTSDAQRMADLCLEYVRIGEFAWSKMEPQPQCYDFDWMDRAIDGLAKVGLKIIIGTPTATPPKWLIDANPDILPHHPKTGRVRGFGSRRHYDFSSQCYLRESLRITRVLAERYGKHPAVCGWQIDNELCCHDTAISVSPSAKTLFRAWCRRKYESIEALNTAWGNVFWSMEYPDFESIDCPFGAVTETAPAHQLAFRRFSSDQVIQYHDAMVTVLREYAHNQFITHNFIPMHETGVDNHALAQNLDFASYDNYPLGRTDQILVDSPAAQLQPYMRTGHPDYASYYQDQTRGLKDRGFWVMEQQPGPVNWANNNPRPLPGMVRLWTLEAFAHGADCVSYFRWRQVPFAQEQMHAGLLRNDDSESEYLPEIRRVIDEVRKLKLKEQPKTRSRVAIMTHAHANWVTDIERQSHFFDADTVQRDFYSALRELGLDVDFVDPNRDFDGYDLILVPCLPIVEPELVQRIKHSNTTFIFGPRSGAKTEDLALPSTLPPGELQSVLPIRVLSVETTRPDCPETLVWNGACYDSLIWRETLDPGECEILATTNGVEPALVRFGNCTYFATLTCKRFLVDYFESLCETLNIPTQRCAEGLRVTRRGNLGFAFNFSARTQTINVEKTAEFLLGDSEVKPQDVAVWRLSNPR